jgi:hypothetical protein
MGNGTARSFQGTATGTADAGDGYLLSASVCGAADAATITVRSGGSGGTVLCKVGAGVGLSQTRRYTVGVPYSNLHVTVTGTTPQWDLECG